MPPTSKPYALRPGRPGLAEIDVVRAAETLLREGKRPTVAAVRERTGGSNSTVAPLLDAWWRSLSKRFAGKPAAFDRIPGALAHVAEALWLQALSEARARAREELTSAQQAGREKGDLEERSLLALREAELEERLRHRDKSCAELEARVRSLTVLLRKAQADAASAHRRRAALQAKLDAIKATSNPRTARRSRPRSDSRA